MVADKNRRWIGAHLSASNGIFAMVECAQSIGANTFAFFTRNPRGGAMRELDEADYEKARQALKKYEFGPLVAHAPYTLNPAGKDPKVRDFAHRAMKEDLERMEYLPGNYYNFHPGSHVGQGSEIGIQLILDLLNDVLRPEQQTTVLLETMAGKGTEIGRSFEEIKAILDGVSCPEKLGVLLDTCHVNDAGYDLVGDFNAVFSEFDRVVGLSHLKALHLNDSKNPLGAHKDRHELIGKGSLGLEVFRSVLNDSRLKDLPMILETPNTLEGYQQEISLLRSLVLE